MLPLLSCSATSQSAQRVYPFSIECAHNANIYAAISQAGKQKARSKQNINEATKAAKYKKKMKRKKGRKKNSNDETINRYERIDIHNIYIYYFFSRCHLHIPIYCMLVFFSFQIIIIIVARCLLLLPNSFVLQFANVSSGQRGNSIQKKKIAEQATTTPTTTMRKRNGNVISSYCNFSFSRAGSLPVLFGFAFASQQRPLLYSRLFSSSIALHRAT